MKFIAECLWREVSFPPGPAWISSEPAFKIFDIFLIVPDNFNPCRVLQPGHFRPEIQTNPSW